MSGRLILLGILTATGCYSGLGTDGDDAPGLGDAGAGDRGASGDATAGDESGEPSEDPRVPPEALVWEAGMRRLSAHEYDTTMRHLLGDDSRPALGYLPEDARDPYDNDYTSQEISEALTGSAEFVAEQIAKDLIADPARRDEVVGCMPAGPGDEACFRDFIARFGRRAFRRPLTQVQVDRYAGLIDHAIDDGDFYTGVHSVVWAMLQDPRFLYRLEIGAPVPSDPTLFRLDDYEVATRLSYFLWGSMPDDWLLDLAEQGGLTDSADVSNAAAQMLQDDKAQEHIVRFHSMWLGYDSLPHEPYHSAPMRAETDALVRRVVFEENLDWQELFRFDETFIDATLADLYGLPSPGTTPDWVPYAGTDRQGVVSHGSFLAHGFSDTDTDPTRRGLAVRSRLFCQDVPLPDQIPPGPMPEEGEVVCKSDFREMHAQPGCDGCHRLMDPIGFGLEAYDQLGVFRAFETDKPECTISGDGEIDGVGEFNGPKELSNLALESGILQQCALTQLYRYAIGRKALDPTDHDFIAEVYERLGAGDYSLDQLIHEFVSDPAFVYRREDG